MVPRMSNGLSRINAENHGVCIAFECVRVGAFLAEQRLKPRSQVACIRSTSLDILIPQRSDIEHHRMASRVSPDSKQNRLGSPVPKRCGQRQCRAIPILWVPRNAWTIAEVTAALRSPEQSPCNQHLTTGFTAFPPLHTLRQ